MTRAGEIPEPITSCQFAAGCYGPSRRQPAAVSCTFESIAGRSRATYFSNTILIKGVGSGRLAGGGWGGLSRQNRLCPDLRRELGALVLSFAVLPFLPSITSTHPRGF